MTEAVAPLKDREHVVYRLFNGEGELLYVGVTSAAGVRFATHAREKPWWPEVARIDVERFPGRQEALRAEGEAILAGNPRHNAFVTGFGPTKIQRFRTAAACWARLGERAQVADSDRTKVINELVAWYNREPGARLPKRPTLPGDDA